MLCSLAFAVSYRYAEVCFPVRILPRLPAPVSKGTSLSIVRRKFFLVHSIFHSFRIRLSVRHYNTYPLVTAVHQRTHFPVIDRPLTVSRIYGNIGTVHRSAYICAVLGNAVVVQYHTSKQQKKQQCKYENSPVSTITQKDHLTDIMRPER